MAESNFDLVSEINVQLAKNAGKNLKESLDKLFNQSYELKLKPVLSTNKYLERLIPKNANHLTKIKIGFEISEAQKKKLKGINASDVVYNVRPVLDDTEFLKKYDLLTKMITDLGAKKYEFDIKLKIPSAQENKLDKLASSLENFAIRTRQAFGLSAQESVGAFFNRLKTSVGPVVEAEKKRPQTKKESDKNKFDDLLLKIQELSARPSADPTLSRIGQTLYQFTQRGIENITEALNDAVNTDARFKAEVEDALQEYIRSARANKTKLQDSDISKKRESIIEEKKSSRLQSIFEGAKGSPSSNLLSQFEAVFSLLQKLIIEKEEFDKKLTESGIPAQQFSKRINKELSSVEERLRNLLGSVDAVNRPGLLSELPVVTQDFKTQIQDGEKYINFIRKLESELKLKKETDPGSLLIPALGQQFARVKELFRKGVSFSSVNTDEQLISIRALIASEKDRQKELEKIKDLQEKANIEIKNGSIYSRQLRSIIADIKFKDLKLKSLEDLQLFISQIKDRFRDVTTASDLFKRTVEAIEIKKTTSLISGAVLNGQELGALDSLLQQLKNINSEFTSGQFSAREFVDQIKRLSAEVGVTVSVAKKLETSINKPFEYNAIKTVGPISGKDFNTESKIKDLVAQFEKQRADILKDTSLTEADKLKKISDLFDETQGKIKNVISVAEKLDKVYLDLTRRKGIAESLGFTELSTSINGAINKLSTLASTLTNIGSTNLSNLSLQIDGLYQGFTLTGNIDKDFSRQLKNIERLFQSSKNKFKQTDLSSASSLINEDFTKRLQGILSSTTDKSEKLKKILDLSDEFKRSSDQVNKLKSALESLINLKDKSSSLSIGAGTVGTRYNTLLSSLESGQTSVPEALREVTKIKDFISDLQKASKVYDDLVDKFKLGKEAAAIIGGEKGAAQSKVITDAQEKLDSLLNEYKYGVIQLDEFISQIDILSARYKAQSSNIQTVTDLLTLQANAERKLQESQQRGEFAGAGSVAINAEARIKSLITAAQKAASEGLTRVNLSPGKLWININPKELGEQVFGKLDADIKNVTSAASLLDKELLDLQKRKISAKAQGFDILASKIDAAISSISSFAQNLQSTNTIDLNNLRSKINELTAPLYEVERQSTRVQSVLKNLENSFITAGEFGFKAEERQSLSGMPELSALDTRRKVNDLITATQKEIQSINTYRPLADQEKELRQIAERFKIDFNDIRDGAITVSRALSKLTSKEKYFEGSGLTEGVEVIKQVRDQVLGLIGDLSSGKITVERFKNTFDELFNKAVGETTPLGRVQGLQQRLESFISKETTGLSLQGVRPEQQNKISKLLQDAKTDISGIASGITTDARLKSLEDIFNKLKISIQNVKKESNELDTIFEQISKKQVRFEGVGLEQSSSRIRKFITVLEGLIKRDVGIDRIRESFLKFNESINITSSNESKINSLVSSLERLRSSFDFDFAYGKDFTGTGVAIDAAIKNLQERNIRPLKTGAAGGFDEQEIKRYTAQQSYLIRAKQKINSEINSMIQKFDDRILESGGPAYVGVREAFEQGRKRVEDFIRTSTNLTSNNLPDLAKALREIRRENDIAFGTASIKAMGGSIGELSKAVGLATKRLTAFVIGASPIYGIISGLRGATSVVYDLDKQFIRLQQIVTNTTSEIDKTRKVADELSGTILNLGKEFGVSSLEIAGSADVLAQAGIQGKKLQEILRTVTKARLGPTFGDAGQISESVIAILNQFEVPASAIPDILGGISQVSAQYAVEAEGITKAVRRAGGAFAAAKADGQDYMTALKEFVAAFTVLKQETREADETLATSLRNVLNRLQRGSVQKFLKDRYQIDLLDQNRQFIGFADSIDKVVARIKELNISSGDPRFAELIEKLSGPLQSSRLKSLIQDADDLKKVTKSFDLGAEILEKDVAIAFQSIENKIGRAREAVVELFTTVGRSDLFKSIVEGFTLGTQALTAFIGQIDKLVEYFGPLSKIAGLFALFKLGSGAVGKSIISTAFQGFRRGLGEDRVYANSGGLVPGTGPNIDTEPYMLTKGEYVVNRNSVMKYGRGFFDKLNAGKIKRANTGSGPGGLIKKSLEYFTESRPSDSTLRQLISQMLSSREALSDKSLQGDQVGVKTIEGLTKGFIDLLRTFPNVIRGFQKLAGDLSMSFTPESIAESFINIPENIKSKSGMAAVASVSTSNNIGGLGFGFPQLNVAKTTLSRDQGLPLDILTHEFGHIADKILGMTEVGSSKSASEIPGTFQNKIVSYLGGPIRQAIGELNKSDKAKQYLGKDTEIFAEIFRLAPQDLKELLISTTDATEGMKKLREYINKFKDTITIDGQDIDIVDILKSNTPTTPAAAQPSKNPWVTASIGGGQLPPSPPRRPSEDSPVDPSGGNNNSRRTPLSREDVFGIKPLTTGINSLVSKIGGWTTVLGLSAAALTTYASSSKDASDSTQVFIQALASGAVALAAYTAAVSAATTVKNSEAFSNIFGGLTDYLPGKGSKSGNKFMGMKTQVSKAGLDLMSKGGAPTKDMITKAGSLVTSKTVGSIASIAPKLIKLGGVVTFLTAIFGSLIDSTVESIKATESTITSEKDMEESIRKRKNLEGTSRALGFTGKVATGAITGSIIGSVVPVIGTTIGGIIGGVLGGLASLVTDFTNSKSAKAMKPVLDSIKSFASIVIDTFKYAGEYIGLVMSKVDEYLGWAIGYFTKENPNAQNEKDIRTGRAVANINFIEQELKTNRRFGMSGLSNTGIDRAAMAARRLGELSSASTTDEEKAVLKENLERFKSTFDALSPTQKKQIYDTAKKAGTDLEKLFRSVDIDFSMAQATAQIAMNELELFFTKIKSTVKNLSGFIENMDANVDVFNKAFSSISGEVGTSAVSDSSFAALRNGSELYGPAMTQMDRLFSNFQKFNPQAAFAVQNQVGGAMGARALNTRLVSGKMDISKVNSNNIISTLTDEFTSSLTGLSPQVASNLEEAFSNYLESNIEELTNATTGEVNTSKIYEIVDKFASTMDQGQLDLMKKFNDSNVKFEQSLNEQITKRLEVESKINDLLTSNVNKTKSMIEFENKAAGRSDTGISYSQAGQLDAQRRGILLRGTGLNGQASIRDMRMRYEQITQQESGGGVTPYTKYLKDQIIKALESAANETDSFTAAMNQFERASEKARMSSEKLTNALLGTDEDLANLSRGSAAYFKVLSGGSAAIMQMSESERKALSSFISGDEEKTLRTQQALGIAPSMSNSREANLVREEAAKQIEANNALISINQTLSTDMGSLTQAMIQNRDAIVMLSTQVNAFNQAVGNMNNAFANMPNNIVHNHTFRVDPIVINITGAESIRNLEPAMQTVATSIIQNKIAQFANNLQNKNKDIVVPIA